MNIARGHGRAAALALLLGAVVVGCGYPVTVEVDNTAGRTDLETFDWARDASELPDDPRINAAQYDEYIREAVETELTAKGYTQKLQRKPDFRVGYQLRIEPKVEEDIEQRRDRQRIRQELWIGRSSEPSPEPEYYEMGTLILSMAIPGQREVLWRGVVEAKVHLCPCPKDRRERINRVVKDILEKFPDRFPADD